MKRILAVAFAALLLCHTTSFAEEVRSQSHSDYAASLWTYLQGADYVSWGKGTAIDQPFGPPACHEGATFANALAVKTHPEYEYGSVVVTDNAIEGGEGVASVTVWYRVKAGFDAKRNDWYWAVFSPKGNVIQTSADKNSNAQRGYYVQEEDGRLWVFHVHNPELGEFLASGDLAKRTTRIGAGPKGETLLSSDNADIDGYLKAAGVEAPAAEAPADEPADPAPATPDPAAEPAAVNEQDLQKEGFVVKVEDGRLWVFRAGSEELAEFEKSNDLAKRVTKVGEGPGGMTLMAPDAETIDAYLGKQPE